MIGERLGELAALFLAVSSEIWIMNCVVGNAEIVNAIRVSMAFPMPDMLETSYPWAWRTHVILGGTDIVRLRPLCGTYA